MPTIEEAFAAHQAGRLPEAEAMYKALLTSDPNQADALHFLGLIEVGKGEKVSAEQRISRAVSLRPERPTYHFNLGFVRLEMGKLEDALSSYLKAIKLKPDWSQAYFNAGFIFSKLKRHRDAIIHLKKALEFEPGNADTLASLAAALNASGDIDEAEKYCREALALNINCAEAYATLGNIQEERGDGKEAERCFERALTIDPAYTTAHYNLGNRLLKSGRIDEAKGCFARTLELDPMYQDARDNLLMARLYGEGESEETIYKSHDHWNDIFGKKDAVHEWPSILFDSGRRIKVGYVSPDFRRHSCAYFLEPLFRAHNRSQVEVFAYSDVIDSDDVTHRLEGLADQWRDCSRLSHQAVCNLVRRDEIDILVDLAGHTGRNRLPVFVEKPAPLQISWLGYPATTGLTAIDARFTDDLADPEGEADRWHSEKLIRLPRGFLCYGSPADAPEVGPLPAEGSGNIAFGSFNNPSKITPGVIAAWAEILKEVEGSTLMIKGKTIGEQPVRERLINGFWSYGVSRERLKLVEWVPRGENPLALYNQVDIGLDTFPYNGTTTTCEALWMGVPVVTFAGTRHAARVGASLLTTVGVAELVADDAASYVDRAVALAGDREKLSHYRKELRTKLSASPLTDGEGFAGAIEEVYRSLWKKCCSEV